jgi:hypothetical protein
LPFSLLSTGNHQREDASSPVFGRKWDQAAIACARGMTSKVSRAVTTASEGQVKIRPGGATGYPLRPGKAPRVWGAQHWPVDNVNRRSAVGSESTHTRSARAPITRKSESDRNQLRRPDPTWVISEPILDRLSRPHSTTCRRRRITRVIIQYRNPRRPDEGAIRFIPDRSDIEAEKRRLEGLGFVIIDISTTYFTRHQA